MRSNQGKSNQATPFFGNKSRWFLVFLLIIGTTITTGGYWLFTSPSGLHWLLSTAARSSAGSLSFEGINGTMRAMRIGAIHFTAPDLNLTVQDAELTWQPSALLSGELLVNNLSIENVEVLTLPSSDSPEDPELPESLRIPLSITIDQFKIAALRVFTEESDEPALAVAEISARLKSDGQQHHLPHLALHLDFGALDASARINGDAPFDLEAQVRFIGTTQWADVLSSETNVLATITGSLQKLGIKVEGQGAGINGHSDAQLLPFAALPISTLHLSLDGLNPKTFSEDAPEANLALRITLNEEITGKLAGDLILKNSTIATLDNGGLPLHEIRTRAAITPELVELHDFSLLFADKGKISGNLSWQIEQSSGLADLSVRQLNPLALDTRLRAARINGSIKLEGDTDAQHGMIALKDDALSFDANIEHTTEAVTLKKLHLSHGQSQFTGQGKLDLTDQQSFNFSGDLKRFNLSDFLQAPSSDLNMSLRLAGDLAPAAGTVNFKIDRSQWAQHAVIGDGQIKFNDLNQLKSKIDVRIGSNQLRAQGGFGKAGDSMHLEVTAPALGQIGLGLDGALHVNAQLGGDLTAPEIQFEVDGKALALPEKQQLVSIVASGGLHGDDISFNLKAHDFRSDEKTQLEFLSIAIAGKKSAHTMQTTVRVNEELEVELYTEGELIQPAQTDSAMQWAGEISQFSATGPFPFHLLASTPLELSAERIFLGTARFEMAGGQANILATQWTPRKWLSQGDFTGVVIHPGGDNLQKQDGLYLGGDWNIESADQLTGNLQIKREKGDLIVPGESPLPLKISTLKLTVQAADKQINGALSVEGERIGKTNANIVLPLTQSGTNWVVSPTAPLNGQIAINIDDLSWIGPILDGNIKSAGQFSLQTDIAGSIDEPKLQGIIRGNGLALALLDQGIQLQEGKLIAHFDKSFLHIDQLNFSTPVEPPPRDLLLHDIKLDEKPGSLAISGVIGLAGDETNVFVELDHLPIAHETNYWIILSGNSRAKLNADTITVDGKIIANAGLLTQPPAGRPQLSDDIIIGEKTEPETEDSLLNLDVTLDLGEQFYIRASGLEGRLAGQLRLQNDSIKGLYANGSIATRDAIFAAYGQKLTVKRGIVTFQGPLDDPGLNVLAVRENLPVEAGVEVIGTVRRPNIRLVSTPNVPDSEKLSWIALGRAPHSGGADTSLLLAAAGSILGGQSGGITDQIGQALGIDEFSIGQAGTGSPLASQTGSQTGNPLASQIGTVGKRLSSRAYINYERGLTSASVGVTKLTYSLTPSISIVTHAGIDSSMDVFYTVQFD